MVPFKVIGTSFVIKDWVFFYLINDGTLQPKLGFPLSFFLAALDCLLVSFLPDITAGFTQILVEKFRKMCDDVDLGLVLCGNY